MVRSSSKNRTLLRHEASERGRSTTVQLRQEEKNRFTSNGNKTKTRIGNNNEGSGRIKSEAQAQSMLENVKTVRQNQDKRVQRIIEGSLQESLRRYIETKRK